MKNFIAFPLLSLAVLLCGACSGPHRITEQAPPSEALPKTLSSNDPISEMAQRLQAQMERDPAFRQELRAELRGRVDALQPTEIPVSAPASEATPESAHGTIVTSSAGLAALIRQAGYQVHPDDPGLLPYFQALAPGEAGAMPVRNGLRVYYSLQGDDLTFVAEIRPLTLREDLERIVADNAHADPAIVQTLNAGVPFFVTAAFGVLNLPAGMHGDLVIYRQTLVLCVTAPNHDVTPDVVGQSVAKFLLALTPNQDVWK